MALAIEKHSFRLPKAILYNKQSDYIAARPDKNEIAITRIRETVNSQGYSASSPFLNILV
jgi:hypothetical protein